MSKSLAIIEAKNIRSKIYTIRNMQVMADKDLAELYKVETKVLNQSVKRNDNRFPEEFMFQLNEKEADFLRSQFVTSKQAGGRRYLPYVFTEQGVAMLSAVLKSETAIKISIKIMNAFVEMRRFLQNNTILFHRLNSIEQKQMIYQINTNKKFEKIFKALERSDIQPKQGIFFDGQIFDAYIFISNLIKKAKQSIILIDNYIDESVLMLLSKRGKKVDAKIYTKLISKQLSLDLEKHNSQYKTIEVKLFNKSHDRFLIIDEKDVYHIGASLKDLGKKWFAFSKLDKGVLNILEKLK